ncbi:MAG: chemotaxis protein CheB [Rhodocyclales bacterium]|nr:chemotaxis protein CheB [Rhodocyclales bacterium]
MAEQTIPQTPNLRAVAIGVSSGGVRALKILLGALPEDFPLPVLVVQHISPEAGNGMARLLDNYCAIRVKEADEQDEVRPATVYLAPPNYHLLVEREGRLALSADPPVSFARPSVDVLFESAAEVFGAGLVGIVLTGANFDGAAGVRAIKAHGGLVIVQDPADAETPQMPAAALAAVKADHVLALAAMPALLRRLAAATAPRAEAADA